MDKLQRHELAHTGGPYSDYRELVEDERGEWCEWEEVEKVIAAKDAEIERLYNERNLEADAAMRMLAKAEARVEELEAIAQDVAGNTHALRVLDSFDDDPEFPPIPDNADRTVYLKAGTLRAARRYGEVERG